VTHDALRRLGVFSVGDPVVYLGLTDGDEANAIVIGVRNDLVEIRYDDDGGDLAIVTWPHRLRHRELRSHDDHQCRIREEALRRLRPVGELFGRGDMERWSWYRRDDDDDGGRLVFSAWDSGASSIFSGMENTELFTRSEAEARLLIITQDAGVHSYEIEGLRRVLNLRRALETTPKEEP